MYGHEELQEAKTASRGRWSDAYAAKINNTVSVDGDDIFVTIDGFDDGEHKWGPCPGWQQRPEVPHFPSKGDDALVVFDDNRIPWIVAWWPYGT